MSAVETEDWQEFLDNSTVGIHLVDGEGKVIWANRKELDFLGYEESEYLGTHIADFHIDEDVIRTILNVLTSGQELSTYPARLKAKDGSTKFVLINSNAYLDENDEFVHTRCFTTEISQTIYFQLRSELAADNG